MFFGKFRNTNNYLIKKINLKIMFNKIYLFNNIYLIIIIISFNNKLFFNIIISIINLSKLENYIY